MPDAITTHQTGSTIPWRGDRLWLPVTSQMSGGAISVQIGPVAPGATVPLHCHGREDELFHVLDGTIAIEVGERRFVLQRGDTLLAPRGVPHRWVTTGSAPGRLMMVAMPGTIEAGFREAAAIGGRESEPAWRDAFERRSIVFTDDIGFRHPIVPSPGQARFIRREEGDRLLLGTDELRVIVERGDTGGVVDIFHARFGPAGVPEHVHHREHEGFLVLDGEVAVEIAGVPSVAGPGAFAWLPRGVPHALRGVGEAPASVLLFATPSGFADFARAGSAELSSAAGHGGVALGEGGGLVAVARRYGIEFAS